MGWFSNPMCPRCGQESSLDTAWDGDFYTCHPCNRKARIEKEEKVAQAEQIKSLEERIQELEKK